MSNKLEPIGNSSTGMKENVAALICALIGPFALIFFFIEKESKFVKFYALESAILSIAVFVVNGILTATVILAFLTFIIGIGQLVLVIIMAIRAYKGEWFEIPLIGKVAMDNSNIQ